MAVRFSFNTTCTKKKVLCIAETNLYFLGEKLSSINSFAGKKGGVGKNQILGRGAISQLREERNERVLGRATIWHGIRIKGDKGNYMSLLDI